MATSSRLQLLQARFQQKQLQEKEQKLLQLYDQQQQRAHQVAQRGSAGSSGSNGSGGSIIVKPAGNVRQLFEERRQQSNVKGIDKGYPLDPLNGRSKKRTTANHRRHNGQPGKRGAKMANDTVAVNNNRAASLSRESYASSRSGSNSFKDSSAQRENYTRESYASSRGDCSEQNARVKHYEINIDEVIDNEAMERNRLLAKFHQIDVDRRRRFDIDSEDILGDEAYFGSRRSSLDPARNATLTSESGTGKGNALAAATMAPVIASVNAAKKPLIPTGARQSTVMRTTKSASLKIRKKVPIGRKALEGRPRSTSLSKINAGKDKAKKQGDSMSMSVGSLDRETDWSNPLKSTSLIFEMIRKTSQIGQIDEKNKCGKVREMVIKIEMNLPSASNGRMEGSSESKVDQRRDEPLSSTVAYLESRKSSMREIGEVSATSQAIHLKNIEITENNEDQGDDGLIDGKEINLPSIRGKRESSVEHPSEYHEITVTDQTIEKRLENRPSRVRRASFELKRMMFEEIQSRKNFQRHDSVESALRHFDSISGEPVSKDTDNCHEKESPTFRLCSKDALKKKSAETRWGFERHTSAWSIRTLRDNAYRHVKSPVPTPRASSRRKTTCASRNISSKKLLQARDSIELTRVPVKIQLPACRRKILRVLSNSRLAENDDASPEKSQRFKRRGVRVARLKRIFSRERSPKNDNFSPSTRSNPDDKAKKNPNPNSSSKSTDDLSERSKPAGSLKFLSRLDGSNAELENGFSTAARRKSSLSAVDGLDDNDKKQNGAIAAAPRTTSSMSSNSSTGTNKSLGSTSSRITTRSKTGPPTPAARSSPKTSASGNELSLGTCSVCNRRFAQERIDLHQRICSKTSQKKRKQFDVVTHRVKGTELESFVQKPNKKSSKITAAKAAVEPIKSNWRRKHEDFINAIRSAKQMQAHLASGGKLADLPPPPPSDTSDYIQCPHCSRKFNQAAAERHIPKCETMQHNKPAARAPVRARR